MSLCTLACKNYCQGYENGASRPLKSPFLVPPGSDILHPSSLLEGGPAAGAKPLDTYIYIYTCRGKEDRKAPKETFLHDRENKEKSAKF